MRKLFLNNQSGIDAYSGDLNTPEIRRSITMHPVKVPERMLDIHEFMIRQKIADQRYRQVDLICLLLILSYSFLQIQLARDIETAHERVKALMGRDNYMLLQHRSFSSPKSSTTPHATLFAYRPDSVDNIPISDFINSNNIRFCAPHLYCPRHSIESYNKYAMDNVIREVTRSKNTFRKAFTQVFTTTNRNQRVEDQTPLYRRANHTYRTVVPNYGVFYIFEVMLNKSRVDVQAKG